MGGGGTVTVKIVGDVDNLKGALNDAEDRLGKLGGSIGSGIATAAKIGGAAMAAFGVASVKAFMDAEQVGAQTAAVIKSTGGAAKISADQVSSLAGSLSKMSGADDEAIQSGENLLLTFTNVQNQAGKGNDIFNQATGIMLDMSTALGQDMSSSAVQLGKALNDPIKGVTALQRVGVSFTDAQKAQIEAMVKSGDVMGAQKLILGELQKEFGGSAKAAGETFAGQINKLKVAVGNFMEDVGARLVPILMAVGKWLGDKLPAAVDWLSTAITPLVRWIQQAIDGFKLWREGGIDLAGLIAGLIDENLKFLPVIQRVIDVITAIASYISDNAGPAFTALAAVIATVVLPPFIAWAAATIAAAAPVIALVAAVGAVTFAAVKAYQEFDTFRNIVDSLKDMFLDLIGALKEIVVTGIDFLKGVWRVFGDDLVSFAREFIASVAEIFRGAINTLSGIFDLIKAVLTGKWGDAWDALKAIVDGVWDTIFGVVRGAVTNVIPTIIAGAGQLIASAARTAFDGLKEPFISVLNWIIDKWNGIKFTVPSIDAGPIHVGGQTIGVPQIPKLHSGGVVPGAPGSETLALLEAGERVIPRNAAGGGDVNVYLNGFSVGTKDDLARALSEVLRDLGARTGTLGIA